MTVFNEEGDYLRRIGYETITNFHNGIDISDAGDVLIGDIATVSTWLSSPEPAHSSPKSSVLTLRSVPLYFAGCDFMAVIPST